MRRFAWGHARRFNSYPEYFQQLFGGRVQKLSIDAGFTCPNRDGSKGRGGCTFCNNNAFNPSYCQPEKSITQQLEEGIEFHSKRYRGINKFMAYFQAYTNTYNHLDRLKTLYSEALEYPGVVGLAIGTRPDCIWEELLDWLGELSEKYYVIVEYGIESCYNKTLMRINRGHTFEDSLKAIDMTAKKGIRQGIHLIIGLPGENESDILSGMKMISRLPVQNIKFHQLQIIRNTNLANEYEKKPDSVKLYSLKEYLDLMIRIIELLNPAFIVERIAGDAHPDYLIKPRWGLRYDEILKKFEDLLENRDTWQGKRFKGKDER
ncbi:MAG: radical SAM protein [Bacteroides sp. SM23_62_1]|nr:MAG: radical SAM protein [Bacteroides sp. SM23_62_1]